MRALVAPDSFKGSLTSAQAAQALALGLIKAGFSQVDKVEMADGGEGTLDAVLRAGAGQRVTAQVQNALGFTTQAAYGVVDDGRTAVIEMAQAAGLAGLRPDMRNPMNASTYGVGQLALHALQNGCDTLYITLGGSATNDGGMGMMQALGARFCDASGHELPPGGAALLALDHIDMDDFCPLAAAAQVFAVCDVDNPLCAEQGASAVFGPQKGATPGMVALLDEALGRLGRVMAHDLGRDVAQLPGAGAAGGLGAALFAFLNAKVLPGADFILGMNDIDARLAEVDLVVTGEGRSDRQTLRGKAPLGVLQAAKRCHVPAICLSGSLGDGWEDLTAAGFAAVLAIADRPMDLDTAMERANELLEQAAYNAGRLFLAGRDSR